MREIFFSVAMEYLREMFLMVSGSQTTKGFPDDGKCIRVSRSWTVPDREEAPKSYHKN